MKWLYFFLCVSFSVISNITFAQTSSISLVKTADPTTVDRAGQTITYSFQVKNTGTTTLNQISISDTFDYPATPPLIINCPMDVLNPGDTTTCTASYTVTQADIDNGSVKNTAIASATTLNGINVTSLSSIATVSIIQRPVLTLEKAGSLTGNGAGAKIDYAFRITNTGNVTISNVSILDMDPSVTIDCPLIIIISPGQTETCTGSYIVTQADMDRGTITNTVTASGTSPDGSTVTAPPFSATVRVIQNATLSLRKSADLTTVDYAGQIINYTFRIINTGNVTLTDIVITDDFTLPAGPNPVLDCSLSAQLAPGQQISCTAMYTATQSDIDNGRIFNVATVNGKTLDNQTITASATLTVNVFEIPALTLIKTANPNTVSNIGDTIDYSFTITNTGNVTLTDIEITDTFTTPANPPLSISCSSMTIAPGETITCIASYIVTQADIDNGSIQNVATVNGRTPNHTPVTSSSSATVNISQIASLSLAKTATPATVSNAGQTINYSFQVTNTGNVRLHDIMIADTFVSPASPPLSINCPSMTIAPGETTTCTASYIVTQADIDKGSIQNTATASGLTPSDAPVTSFPSSATVNVSQTAGLSLTNAVEPSLINDAGQIITYSFQVTNIGNVTLQNISIADNFVFPADPPLDITCLTTTLEPGETTTCTATYMVTQADVDNGIINNSAVANGMAPDGSIVASNISSTHVSVNQTLTFSLLKTASPNVVSSSNDIITYSFELTNTGNNTLSHILIADTFVSPAGPTLAIDCLTTTLEPGETTVCIATYSVTQADIDHGIINNSAVADGMNFNGHVVTSNISSVAVRVNRIPIVLPPRNVIGFRKLECCSIVGLIKWKAPVQGNEIAEYKIFKDKNLTHLVAEISSKKPLRFIQYNLKKGKTYTYFIVSVDKFGNQSIPVKVKIKRRKI